MSCSVQTEDPKTKDTLFIMVGYKRERKAPYTGEAGTRECLCEAALGKIS